MDYRVIDDFLPPEVFERYSFLLSNNFPLFYTPYVSSEEDNKNYYLTHLFYAADVPTSDHFNHFINPLINHPEVDVKALIRAKAGFYPRGNKIVENGLHVDMPYPHKNIVFYVNTCDGFTRLEDGTKIKSVANRALLLDDGLIKHNSTNTTSSHLRCTIAINYF